jgi:DivIVA domain-containing protein
MSETAIFAGIGWAILGFGALSLARAAARPVTGRAGPGGWRRAGPDLARSVYVMAFGGLELLEIFMPHRTVFAWVLAGVVCTPVLLDTTRRIRARRRGAPVPGPGGQADGPVPVTVPAPSSPGYEGGAELARWVDRQIFATTRLHPGYDEEEVDRLLDAIRDTFLGTAPAPVTPDDLTAVHFTATRVRPGYVGQEVDSFLRDVRLKLAEPAGTPPA